MHAGQIARSARKAANMTLAELGERCGYPAAQISRYERGVTRLTDISLLRAFAAILAIPPAALGLAAPGDSPSAAESPSFPPGSRSVALDDSGKDDDVLRKIRELPGVVLRVGRMLLMFLVEASAASWLLFSSCCGSVPVSAARA